MKNPQEIILMSRFEAFELPIKKIQDYPLVYEALIPMECSLFQDVRRYQSVTAHLSVNIINIDGKIQLDHGMVPVPMSKLTSAEKKEFIDYLKIRIARGDNIGSSWAFFRSDEKKKTMKAYGANIVFKDASTGHSRAIALLKELQKSGPKTNLLIKIFMPLLIMLFLGGIGYFAYQTFFLKKDLGVARYMPDTDSREMKFYRSVFPEVYQWKDSDLPDKRSIAKALLKPEYVAGPIDFMDKPWHKEEQSKHNYKGVRLTLFVYFNYNEQVKDLVKKYRTKLEGTEFNRLSNIYNCAQSNYVSNIFYFKVGDLDLRSPQITKFMTDNMISYNDYTRLRDAEEFSEMLKKDTISFKLKNFLSDVYTFTPLKVDHPVDEIDWYLLTKGNDQGKISFAAFFRRDDSTLLPREISRDILDNRSDSTAYTWYEINSDQRKKLGLSASSLRYFTEKIGQAFKLEVVAKKIEELELKKINTNFPVSVHRELLMEDSSGKYGIQCFDPLTSLVLSNLISKSSFEETDKITLKRDPIQVNTTLVQLSRDDSTSTQAINISPGRTGIVELFKQVDYFRGKLSDGRKVRFEKADTNLFNPFSFMVYNDSITFSYKHEIGGMEFAINEKILKIIKSADGGYQIVETN